MEPWTGWTEDKPVVHPAHPLYVSETQREEGLVQLVASAPPAWDEEGRGEVAQSGQRQTQE